MKKFFNEFKQFAMQGNMMDMAIGIIIGTAFSSVINSLVNDILMPLIGRLIGNINFDDLFISLNGQHYNTLADAVNASAPILRYGTFLSIIINFIIIAFCLFLIVKAINKFSPKPKVVSDNMKDCPYCLEKVEKAATRCPYCTSVLPANNETT